MEKDKQMIVRVSESLKNKFEKHCEENGYSISKRLRLLIQSDIQTNSNLNDNGYSLQNDKSNKVNS